MISSEAIKELLSLLIENHDCCFAHSWINSFEVVKGNGQASELILTSIWSTQELSGNGEEKTPTESRAQK